MEKFFYIRIVLHNASADQYVKLADELLRHGITDVMEICGVRRKLPPGEYWKPATHGIGALETLLIIRPIASRISMGPDVVVVHGTDIQGMFGN